MRRPRRRREGPLDLFANAQVALALALLSLWPAVAWSGEDLLTQARELAEEGRFDDAAEAYRRALAEDPDSVALLPELARTLARAGQHAEAVEIYERALAGAPQDVESRIALGRVLAWMGRFQEAETQLELALSQENTAEAHLTLGDVQAWQQQFEAAERSYSEARLLAPQDARPAIRLGRVQLWKGDREGARSLFREALRREPESSDAQKALERLDAAGSSRRFRVDLGLRHDDVRENREGWWQQWFYAQMRPSESWLVFAGIDRYRRSGARDQQWTFGSAVRLPSQTWLTARVSLGPDAEVVARQVYELELSHPLSERWATHLRHRHSRYAGGVWADITTPGLQYTWSPYARVLAQYYYTRVSDGVDSHSGSLRLTFFPEYRLSFEVGGAAGKQGFAATSVDELGTEKNAVGMFAGTRIALTERVGLHLAYEYEKIEDTYRRHGVAAGLSFRF